MTQLAKIQPRSIDLLDLIRQADFLTDTQKEEWLETAKRLDQEEQRKLAGIFLEHQNELDRIEDQKQKMLQAINQNSLNKLDQFHSQKMAVIMKEMEAKSNADEQAQVEELMKKLGQ